MRNAALLWPPRYSRAIIVKPTTHCWIVPVLVPTRTEAELQLDKRTHKDLIGVGGSLEGSMVRRWYLWLYQHLYSELVNICKEPFVHRKIWQSKNGMLQFEHLAKFWISTASAAAKWLGYGRGCLLMGTEDVFYFSRIDHALSNPSLLPVIIVLSIIVCAQT